MKKTTVSKKKSVDCFASSRELSLRNATIVLSSKSAHTNNITGNLYFNSQSKRYICLIPL